MVRKLTGLVVFVSLTACGKKSEDSDATISTTRVRPPVQENLPANLLTSGSFSLTTADTDYSKTCQTDAAAGDACTSYTGSKKLRCIVKNRLFCKGPTEVLSLLDSLDSRLKEIEARTSGATNVPCLAGTSVDLTTQLTYPGSETLNSKYKCRDTAIGLGFGQDSGVWYLRESTGTIGKAFTIAADTSVHGYIWLASKDGTMSQSTGLIEVATDKTAKTVEITGGGAGFGFCGLHFKSNATNIYLTMNPAGTGGSCDYTGNGTTDSSDWVDACLDASTLDDATSSACTSLKTFTLKTKGRDTTTATGGLVTTYEAVAPLASGTVSKFEMKTYLLDLATKAATFEGVTDFSASK